MTLATTAITSFGLITILSWLGYEQWFSYFPWQRFSLQWKKLSENLFSRSATPEDLAPDSASLHSVASNSSAMSIMSNLSRILPRISLSADLPEDVEKHPHNPHAVVREQ
ncbi:hypothetical protein H0H81_010123 [Sphagnurus paluster]|uniref:Uncharacterized protein n=1 Tax=Sphagnurus paluster TaxID=117069 RepID=A0A9P7GPF1_9AGAR|nr:hypothetical protein H0H81_010123 [Sphagnurus paluster]